ncbi:DEAD/DEAH box helicase [Bifidobacterium moukalabense]|uniref:DEAD/DEAH box helicase n=1 Tax=Bifidobacterium moukalabense TaxID=1333651 RepID=UPI0010FA1245|nr:DEAD/DEAH box helicase [Bifidobacterium moukalabense]
MYECLNLFSEPTKAWFERTFACPTDAQRQAWPAIHSGGNVLVIAPTGSGKTLCAFLSAIDSLMGETTACAADDGGGRSGKAVRGVRVLYISPLKALGVDVAKNLETPLHGIADQCKALGLPAPKIRVSMRSGDTTPKERRRMVSHPPDILVTTPESLFLMLTSKARRILSTVETVIIDEVHAVAGSKRGAHLALSLERLDGLVGRPVQRIGLSATVNPPEEAARFLGGVQAVRIVDPGTRPAMDVRVVEPLDVMHERRSSDAKYRAGGADRSNSPVPHISGVTPAMESLAERRGIVRNATSGDHASPGPTGGSAWPAIERSVLDEVLKHHTTLVFVNSRGLAERLTARLNDMYADASHAEPHDTGSPGSAGHYDSVIGPTTMLVGSHADGDAIAMAHHGSVSKDRRKQIEERLKRGRLRCVVATSSLELGIDMGSVDLVIQIAPPLSVSSGLQRVGRADHRVGGVSHALFYPITREQIIGTAACIECMQTGDIEPLAIPGNPLDVLAQQTVAAAAMGDLDPDEWYGRVRRAAPFTDLDRSIFDAVMAMMTGAYNSEDFSAFRPPLQCNEESGLISARPGAQRLAVTSGGTIPDRGMYTVVLPEAASGPGPRRVGELDEEMVYESRVGDVITLGTSTWRIEEITRDRVVVVPAPGRTARLPFWHGEGDGRDYGLGLAQGRFLREVAQGLHARTSEDSGHAKDGCIGAEARFDARIVTRLRHDGLDDNAIGNLADLLEEQRAATGAIPNDRELVIERCRDEEGDWRVVIHSPYGRRVHEPWAMAITTRIRQHYGFDGQVYAADDGIIIHLPDGDGGLPVHALILFDIDELQRIIETQVGESVLYAARFRECAARALFLPRTDPGKRVPLWQQRLRAAQLLNAARTRGNFPLLLETARECLQDVYDLPALRHVMTGLNSGTIALADVTTETPSPFAENMLFGFVGAVMYQYDVPQAESSTQLLSMDPEVLERLLGDTDMSTVLDADVVGQIEDELAEKTFWNDLDAEDVTGRVSRYAKTHGPFIADRMIAELNIDAVQAVRTLDELHARGDLLKGHFVDVPAPADPDRGRPPQQWLHKDIFRRIRSRSLAKARKAVKPVSQQTYQAFLLDRQGVGPVGGERYEGIDGLMRVIEQLEGVSLAAQVWESSVFPARVRGYHPSMLDELIASGDVIWVGDKTGDTDAKEVGNIAFYPVDSPLASETAGVDVGAVDGDETLTVPQAIVAALRDGGAFHASQLSAAAKSIWERHAEVQVNDLTGEITFPTWGESQFEEALWSLVWQGRVTNSSFGPIRARMRGTGRTVRAPRTASRRRVRVRTAVPMTLSGLWSAIGVSGPVGNGTAAPNGGAEERGIARIESLLDRYGIIAAPLVDRERIAGGFSGLYPVLKRMEEHGTLVRGMFVDGFGAAQFAGRDTVDALRSEDRWHSQSCVALDVTDPASLMGSAIAWPERESAAVGAAGGGRGAKPARRAGSIIVFKQGGPVLFAVPKSHRITAFADTEDTLRPACAELVYALQRQHSGSISFNEMNGESLKQRNEYMRLLHAAGFTESPQGMKLYR